jgi:hypothetical protein
MSPLAVPILVTLPSGGHTPHAGPSPWTEALARALAGQAEAAELAPGCRLHEIHPPLAPAPGGWPLAVLLAAPSPDGIRRAYAFLKAIAPSAPRQVGMVLAGVASPDTARRCQERLAAGASRFLGVPVLDLGHLPDPADRAAASDSAARIHRLVTTSP